MVWRIAATALVVAVGTLAVVRSQNGSARSEAIAADSALVSSPATAAAISPTMSETTSTSSAGSQFGAVSASPRTMAPTAQRIASAPASKQAAKIAAANPRSDAVRANAGIADAASVADTQKVAVTQSPPADASAPRQMLLSRVPGVAVMDRGREVPSLKVVGTPRTLGAKVTLYEIAPGDTVTLTESVPMSLESVVVTSIGTTRMQGQAAGRTAAAAAKRAEPRTTTAPDSQPTAVALSAAPSAQPAPNAQAGLSGTTNVISWVDPATGATLTLTGRISPARLQEIKTRIERERAAAAKKTP
jgi:hypothetical protein